MAISTNSIIHYTDSIDKLESILIAGFAIKYCSESLFLESGTSSLAAHPMISFCDIPLSDSGKHFDAYGRFGIGLSKVWAKNHGINPVLYIDNDSSISRTLAGLISERRLPNSNLTKTQKEQILRIKCFTKNYSGHLKRGLVDNKKYRYYDEREWRLVPEASELKGAPFSVTLSAYLRNKIKYNTMIKDLRFIFDASDISYIIVDKTSEIPRLINTLRSEYASRCTARDLDILFSKICSTEQILSDY